MYTSLLQKYRLPTIIQTTALLLLLYICRLATKKTKTYHNSQPYSGNKNIHHTIRGQYDKSMAAWPHHIRNKTERIQYVPPTSRGTARTHWKLPLARIKILFCPKMTHYSIPSRWTLFMTLTYGIWVLYIAINSNRFWCNS